jgi:hypothetical protein
MFSHILYIYALCLLLLLQFAQWRSCSAQPDGWKMTDRFHGFRFEAPDFKPEYLDVVKRAADDNNCFGWVQQSPQNTLVGEARCAKSKGVLFENWLKQSVPETVTRSYDDSKIRLHFAYFKILEAERDTCFLDAPHQCQK